MRAVRILGVDPGTVVVGFGCLVLTTRRAAAAASGESRPLAHRVANARAAGGGRAEYVDAGTLQLGRRRAIQERLLTLAREVGELLDRLQPDELALEEAFHGRSVQSALRLGEARGVVLAEAARREIAVHQFPPATVKRSVAGHGAATKEAVARMVSAALGRSDLELELDASDALALALCRVEQSRSGI